MSKLKLPKGVKQNILALSSVLIGAKKEVEAIVFGLLALHPINDMMEEDNPHNVKSPGYKITHVPSGKRVVTLYGFQYAKKATQLLSVSFDWSFRDISELSAEDREDLVGVLNVLYPPCFAIPRNTRKILQKEALEIVEAGVKAKLERDQGVLPFESPS